MRVQVTQRGMGYVHGLGYFSFFNLSLSVSIKYIVLELGGEGNQAGSIAQQGFKKILILDTKCLILSPLIKSWLPAGDVFLDVGYFAAVFVADGLVGLVTILCLVGG